MVKEVLWEVPHIKLAYLEGGELCLIVEDTELNDYVEDFLWDEYDFIATSVSVAAGARTAIYNNYLDVNIPLKELIEVLSQLDLNEVERIYKLNN